MTMRGKRGSARFRHRNVVGEDIHTDVDWTTTMTIYDRTSHRRMESRDRARLLAKPKTR